MLALAIFFYVMRIAYLFTVKCENIKFIVVTFSKYAPTQSVRIWQIRFGNMIFSMCSRLKKKIGSESKLRL